MSRFQDIALGAGVLVCLAALVACAVQMAAEVLAVERDRRRDVGGGQSAGARPDAQPAPSPDAAARVVAELEGRS